MNYHYGVFPHSEKGVVTNRGYVVRKCDPQGVAEDAYNYGGVQAVKLYCSRDDAEKYAARLNGEGVQA